MSSGEPLWFCHECNAEMRPLMIPDPTCASCHSTFVEKIEDPSDDPREFRNSALTDISPGDLPPELEVFLSGLQDLIDHGSTSATSPPHRNIEGATPDNRFRFEIRSSGPAGNSRSIRFGGPSILHPRSRTSSGEVPSVSQFRRANGPSRDAPISAPLMAQYLSALMGMRGGLDTFGSFHTLSPGDVASHGRLGDYAFNQEALDRIITHLMETSNSSQPVPATEEIISNLPREVLESGSATLEKECAVCKDQFQLETEDPEEQVVVTLPCKHSFHEGCIIPWLKSSGTCPVCRHALIAQPEHHPPGPGPGPGNAGPSSPSTRPSGQSSPRDRSGLFNTIFGFAGGLGGSSGNSEAGSRTNANRLSRSNNSGRPNIPGSWSEQTD